MNFNNNIYNNSGIIKVIENIEYTGNVDSPFVFVISKIKKQPLVTNIVLTLFSGVPIKNIISK